MAVRGCRSFPGIPITDPAVLQAQRVAAFRRKERRDALALVIWPVPALHRPRRSAPSTRCRMTSFTPTPTRTRRPTPGICLRRHPSVTCLSNFGHYFSDQSIHLDHSCDLLDTGRYHVLFDFLMAHWRHVLPGRIHEVHYETLVILQEATSRKRIDCCGLSWNDPCLHFENRPTALATRHSPPVCQSM